MSNLNDSAFPWEESGSTDTSYSCGLTKHEYAAILIAQGLVSKYTPHAPGDQKTIAQLAKEFAGEILKQFE